MNEIMPPEELMSVTELAHQVGVSVRTIQYYDQMGLLSPNKKGPNNQRLYTEQERERLYRILVLKYLGYPLKEIRAGAGPDESVEVKHCISEALDRLEPEFLELFKRMATLRKLASPAEEGASWAELARVIEAEQDKGPLYWQAMSIQDGEMTGAEPASIGETIMDRSEANAWHGLVRASMQLVQNNVPATDSRARQLAAQFMQMGGAARATEGVSLMVTSMGSHGMMPESAMRPIIDKVIAYLQEAANLDAGTAGGKE